MTSLSARRFMSACILSAAAVAALVAPGAASAAGKLGQQCSGSNITGKGSSLQKLAQQSVWNPDFNTSTSTKGCSGTQGSGGKPTVTYTSVGSGAGLEAWGVNGHAFEGTNGYVGTDEPPNQLQKEEIQAHSSNPAESTLQTIPVLQGAVAIIVRLPNNCESTSTASPGRLVLDNVTLEKIFRGQITKWSEITESGDELLTSAGDPTKCKPETPIVRAVREDQSGTTHIFKKYLSLIYGEKNVLGELGWTELSEGVENTEWPGTVLKPSASGGGALVKLVSETPASIGYANLADARSNGTFGGPKVKRYWVPIQNNGVAQTGETYTYPGTNGFSKVVANANCENTEYTNGETPFPPASTAEVWNEVTTSTTEPNYTICGLSYDLTFSQYSKYPETTLEEATTVNNFMRWVTAFSGGGQTEIKKHDYLALTTALQLEAAAGAERTKF